MSAELCVLILGVVLVAGVVIWEEIIKPRKKLISSKSRKYREEDIDQLLRVSRENREIRDVLSKMRIALLECAEILVITKSDWTPDEQLLKVPDILKECMKNCEKIFTDNKNLNEEIKQLREVINDLCDYSIIGIDKISTVDLIEIAKRVNTEKKELSILASGFANHSLFDSLETEKSVVDREKMAVEAENLRRKELENDSLYSVVDGFARLLSHIDEHTHFADGGVVNTAIRRIYGAVEQTMEELQEKLYKKQLKKRAEE